MWVRFSRTIAPPGGVARTICFERTWSQSRRNRACARRVIFEPSYRVLRPFRLQGAALLEMPRLDRSPAPLAKETAVARHGRLHESKVNPDHVIGRGDLGTRHGDHDVQPPDSIAGDQVGRIFFAAGVPSRVGWQVKRDRLPPARGGKPHRARRPVQPHGVDVVTGRTGSRARLADLASRFLESQRRLDGLSRLDPGLDMEIGYECRILRLERAGGRVMQRHAILLPLTPAVRRHRIEDQGEQAAGLNQCRRLLGGRRESHTDRSLHRSLLPHAARLTNERRQQGQDVGALRRCRILHAA